MIRKTKRARLQITTGVIKQHKNKEKPLGEWLTIINEHLPTTTRFRNTIELARAFKTIPGMNGRQTWTLREQTNTSIVYYTYDQQQQKIWVAEGTRT